MIYKNLPTWLKGGIIGATISIICLLLIVILPTEDTGLLTIWALFYIPLLPGLYFVWVADLFGNYMVFFYVFLFNVLFASFIGWLINEIKMKKQKRFYKKWWFILLIAIALSTSLVFRKTLSLPFLQPTWYVFAVILFLIIYIIESN